MDSKRNNFTKKILFTLFIGLSVGIATIALREWLTTSGNSSIWETINKLLFVDISVKGNEDTIGLFYIIGQIFLRLLQLVLIPLIFTSIIRAIEKLHDTALLNKLSRKAFSNFAFVLSLALILGTVVGFSAYSLGWFQLSNLSSIEIVESTATHSNPLLIVLNAFNNNIVTVLGNNGNIIAVVVLAIFIGVLLQQLGSQITILRKIVEEVYLLSMKLLDIVIIKFGPLAIFCLLVRTFAAYGIQYLQPALVYMVVTSITLLVMLFLIFPIVVTLKTGLSPIIFIKKVYKTAVFGFSTSSSAATLPLTQETVMNDFGVDESVASFIVPLASTINMTGTAIMQIIACLFIASVAGYSVGLIEMISIVLLTVIGSISTPAAPGAGAILLFTIISGLGFTSPEALAAYSFILAINRPVEMIVTATNVVDDSVSALCIASDLDLIDLKVYNQLSVINNNPAVPTAAAENTSVHQ